MLNILITSVEVIVLLILCKLIKNLYTIYALYPKESVHKGFIAWGIVAEALWIVYLFIKIVT